MEKKQYSPDFKIKVALAALTRQAPMAELVRRFEVPADLIRVWERQAQDCLNNAFAERAGGYQVRKGERRRRAVQERYPLSPEEREFFDRRRGG